jgi:hypothetical protein
MVEIIVTVEYKGKNYLTNVIADKGMTGEEIKLLAENQVSKQWSI